MLVLLCDERFEISVDEFIEVSVHDFGQIAFFIAGSMIFDQGIRHEGIGTDLRTPYNALLFELDVFEFGFLSLDLQLIKLRFQHVHGRFTVVELRSFGLAVDDDARR